MFDDPDGVGEAVVDGPGGVEQPVPGVIYNKHAWTFMV